MQGHDLRKIQKAAGLDIDCICMDIEDGVAYSRKRDARDGICSALNTIDFGKSERLVRINPIGSGSEQEDIDAANSGPLDGIVIPKTETPDHVKFVADRTPENVKLIIMAESPSSLLNLSAMLTASPRVEAVIFGGDDYAALADCIRSREHTELDFARQWVVMHAAAAGKQAIDVAQIDLGMSEPDLVLEGTKAFSWGFAGKQLIHPKQIAPTQRAFTPSADTIDYAKRVVDAYNEFQSQGRGAFTFEGRMIDAPTMKQFEKLLLFTNC